MQIWIIIYYVDNLLIIFRILNSYYYLISIGSSHENLKNTLLTEFLSIFIQG